MLRDGVPPLAAAAAAAASGEAVFKKRVGTCRRLYQCVALMSGLPLCLALIRCSNVWHLANVSPT